jgi:hypothetical protein
MIEVNSTGDSSVTEVQVFQFLQFRNGRWYLCDAQQKSAAITGVMTTEQTCQRQAVFKVQFLQIDASFNSIDVWNAQQKSAVIMG